MKVKFRTGCRTLDTELARTFLAVVAAGNFVKAAERLFVTQSTVSSRIQSLEQQLGCRLFVRNKAGTSLTSAGRQFQKHAVNLLRTVEQARQDVGILQGYRASLTVGGRFGIWEDLLLRWLPLIRTSMPDVAVRAEIGFEEDLMLGLVDGRIDIGVMYTPQSRPGLSVEPLLEEELILVQTESSGPVPPMAASYVYIDWGSEFRARHGAAFPDFTGSGLSANIGWLALQHILDHGGSGYFPQRLVANYLVGGQLQEVSSCPTFSLPVYLVYPAKHDPDIFAEPLSQIRKIAAEVTSR